MHYTGSSPGGENKNRHKCHVCSENSPKITLQLVHFAPSQPPAFKIQSILLNDSASLRFAGHDKGERPEACPETVGWLASLALYKCRAFSLRFLLATYFRLAGGTNPTRSSLTKIDRESKPWLAIKTLQVYCPIKNLWPQHQLGPQA